MHFSSQALHTLLTLYRKEENNVKVLFSPTDPQYSKAHCFFMFPRFAYL
jgi:hypothetical protein